MKNPSQRAIEFGQSIWYDNISRDLLNSGELKKIVSDWGIRGLTSNPSIFDNAIRSSNCLLYTSPSPRDQRGSRMPSSA